MAATALSVVTFLTPDSYAGGNKHREIFHVTPDSKALIKEFNRASSHGKKPPVLVIETQVGNFDFHTAEQQRRALSLLRNDDSNIPTDIQLALYHTTLDGPIPMDFFERMGKIENRSFDLDARNKHTKACGLFQITPALQLQLMAEQGNKFPEPYKTIASHTESYVARKDAKGRPIYSFRVKKGFDKKEVMKSCEDPVMNTLLTREYILYNAERLKDEMPKRKLTYTDIYLAHFLDAPNAARFIRLAENPKTHFHRASDYFKQEARRNKGMFYTSKGHPRSFTQIYDHIKSIMSDKVINLDGAERVSSIAPQNGLS